LGAIIMLGTRNSRYREGRLVAFAPSNIPFLALGSWVLTVGWFGFNVMSAQTIEAVSGLVAVNSLMAMVGGILMAMFAGRRDPGFIHNGPLAGLVAVCAGSDLMHPIGALVTGGIAGGIFVYLFEFIQKKLPKVDDVLGVWPLHGVCGLWGGIAAGIFGTQSLGGMGGVTFLSQLIGSLAGAAFAVISGLLIYGVVNAITGIRLSEEDEFQGADLAIHKIGANSIE
jgi:Amt family ammonium transporter